LATAWLALLVHVWEVPGPTLGSETGSGFLQSVWENADHTLQKIRIDSFQSYQLIILPFDFV